MGLSDMMNGMLGLEAQPKDLTVTQVCVRAVIVFIVTLVIVRCAHKRFLSKMTAFDTVLGFILASGLARAINGSAPFCPTLAMGFVLVVLHRLVSALAFRSPRLGAWVKGQPDVLVESGVARADALRRHRISEHDLLEEARLNGQVARLEQIQTATLERSGEISIIKAK